jgi:NodT family efflux transporter outer membrane factor (OMF) lipoprotein
VTTQSPLASSAADAASTIVSLSAPRVRTWLAAAAVWVLAACTVGPRYHHPETPAPPTWHAREADVAAAATGNAAEAAPAWPSSEWWHGFSSPQLDELMKRARSTNDDIAAAMARVREADAQVRIAGAPLLPSISVAGSSTRERTRPVNAVATGAPPLTFNQFGAEATASYEADFWGKNLAARRSAQLAALASRYDRQTIELTVMTSVATTYFQAIELHDRLNVAQQNLVTAQTILKGLSAQASTGIATALDVAQQETTVATVSASIPPLEQQLRQAINALAVLTGQTAQTSDFPGGELSGLSEPEVRPGLPSELLARRPDVAQAEAQLMAANADIASARAAFFPSFSLTADGGYVSSTLSDLFTPANRVFAVTGALVQQIFAGGALTGRYRLTEARYSELLADYHKTVLSAFSDVENALVAQRQTAEQYQRQLEAVAKARRAYEFAETQMRAGVVNVLTVLNTQTALFNAQDTLVQVRFAHLQALVQLFNALGGGWQKA